MVFVTPVVVHWLEREIAQWMMGKAMFYIYMHQPTKNSTYDGLCYTSRGALAGTRNSSMDDGKNPLFYIYMHQPTKNSTYDGLCYTSHTSRGALAGMRNS